MQGTKGVFWIGGRGLNLRRFSVEILLNLTTMLERKSRPEVEEREDKKLMKKEKVYMSE